MQGGDANDAVLIEASDSHSGPRSKFCHSLLSLTDQSCLFYLGLLLSLADTQGGSSNCLLSSPSCQRGQTRACRQAQLSEKSLSMLLEWRQSVAATRPWGVESF